MANKRMVLRYCTFPLSHTNTTMNTHQNQHDDYTDLLYDRKLLFTKRVFDMEI